LYHDRTVLSFYKTTYRLENNYPDEFHVDVDYEPQIDNDEWLKQYDIIHYHRTLGDYDNMEKLTERLKKFRIISIMDLPVGSGARKSYATPQFSRHGIN
jgi:hypothetical protein